jgi:hypothetical protein
VVTLKTNDRRSGCVYQFCLKGVQWSAAKAQDSAAVQYPSRDFEFNGDFKPTSGIGSRARASQLGKFTVN